jgi:uncharacterized membrane protein
MIRWLLWIAGGALMGGIVHLATVLYMPASATQDAYTRIAAISPVNAMAQLAAPTSDNTVVPFMDPAFASAVCRYDLGAGPLRLRVPVSPAYTSVSFYTRKGVAYYAINDRAAGRRQIELELMTKAQRATLTDGEETAADRLIVESPGPTGLIVLRALAPEPGMMEAAQAALAAARCEIQNAPAR